MASKLGTVFVELSLDDKVYKQKLSETLTTTQATARGIETSWRALGAKSEAVYDAQRKAAQNAYTLIKNSASSTANDIVRAEQAKTAKIEALNQQQFGKQVDFLQTIKSHWLAVSAAVYAAWSLIGKAIDYVTLGAKVKSIEDSFTLMARNSGVAIDGLIADLKRVTNETIDDSDLMVKATRLISEGLGAEQIVVVAEAARTAARLTGTTVSEAYDRIADSLVNLRARGLKTAGFIIDIDEAERKHAKSLGVTKDQLNDYGKQMAWSNAIKEKNVELTDKLNIGQQTEYENLQKINARWKQFKEDIAGVALTGWIELQSYVTSTYEGILKLMGLLDRIAGKTKPGGTGLYEGIGQAFTTKVAEKSQIKSLSDAELKKFEAMADKAAESWTKVQGAVYGTTEAMNMYDYGLDETTVKLDDLVKRQDAENKAAEDFAQTMADDMFPSLQKVNEIVDKGEKYWIDYNKQLAISKDLIRNMDWDSVASGATQLSSDTERAISQTTIVIQRQVDSMRQTEDIVGGISQNISDVWANNMSKMITDAESFSDAMDNIWKGMADSFVSAIMKMIVNWILFGNITGEKNSSGGYGGIVGSVVSIIALLEKGGKTGPLLDHYPIRSYATGGIAKTPQLGIFGEGGGEGEAFVPLQGGKIPVELKGEKKNESGIQNANLIQIVCMDPISWRDFVRRNPEAIIEAISKNARGAGAMRGTIKGVG